LSFLFFASVALAQDPYAPGEADVDVQVGRAAEEEAVAGNLPFTGLDLVLVLLAASALVGIGLLTRRLASARGTAK
jgi:hypothetical protein